MTLDPAAELVPAPPDTLAIDFANTRYWRGSPAPTETLSGLPDLLDWAATTAVVAPATLARLRATWSRHPKRAAAAFTEAVALREAMFRSLAAASADEAPQLADLALLNDALAEAPARRRLRQSPAGRGWEVALIEARTASLLAPVLWSAADLLLVPKLARVRQCANPACGYLFLDDSKAGNRRWCSMSACGNRAKAHRHYLRRKAITPPAA